VNILGYLREDRFEDIDGPTYYRAYLPLREVNRQDDDIEVTLASYAAAAVHSEDDDPFWERDVFVLPRMAARDGCQEYVDKIHGLGAVVVLDSDDDLTETHKLVSGHGPEFREVLGIVDYVTVSTQPLADLFAQYTQRPPVVLRNCVDGAWMQHVASTSKRLDPTKLMVGFTGSPTHWGDWRLPAVPFSRILRTYKDTVRGILLGEVPRYLGFAAPDLMKIQGVPFVIYPIALKQFDIVLCAVDVHDDFNAGKSAVKALECMALGVVPICSPFGPYLELKDGGAPVVIVSEDSQDGWYEAMRNLIEDEQLRWGLSKAGPGWVAENRDMVRSGWRAWADFYRSIA
jgi:glycosyltransferase involved in cell wall biosynthesis